MVNESFLLLLLSILLVFFPYGIFMEGGFKSSKREMTNDREREKRERKEEDTFTELRKRRPSGNRLESTKRSSLHYYSSKAKEAASERGFDVNLCIANERSRLDFPFFWGVSF